jgi:hypothetical protein
MGPTQPYALVRRESPAEMIQEETEALRAMLEERRTSQLKKSSPDAAQTPPDRTRLRDRQRPTGLHRLLRRLCVGRIYKTRGGPDSLRWFWSRTVNGPMTRADKVATLEEAKAQFQKSWDAWKAWAKLEEVA